ncbi:MAG: lipopolysaccharide core biosynthesis protein [Verrucomicrobiales bacterium]|nr:lipopolysaccharide core biosynthesis protein [Verrucomicrobiales bacterium]
MARFDHILVIRGGAIGDFILTMPVLAALRESYPTARIELLANPSVGSLAVYFGFADKVRDLGSIPFVPLFADNRNCPQEVAVWLSGFDLIVSYTHDPLQVFQTNIRRYTKAQFIAGPHRPDELSASHASEQLLQPVSDFISSSFDVGRWKLDVERSSTDFSPSPPPREERVGERRHHLTLFNGGPSPSATIAIHSGSGSPQKNWPQEKWGAFLQHLVATTDDKILLIGGEAERETLPALAKLVPQNRSQLALELPLVELMELLKQCRVFIGHDSGPTHLAAILGLDCIVLWGPSNERVWRPLGERVEILRHAQTLKDLPVETVVNALNSLLTTP